MNNLVLSLRYIHSDGELNTNKFQPLHNCGIIDLYWLFDFEKYLVTVKSLVQIEYLTKYDNSYFWWKEV